MSQNKWTERTAVEGLVGLFGVQESFILVRETSETFEYSWLW